jgi:hypothetical protein
MFTMLDVLILILMDIYIELLNYFTNENFGHQVIESV